MSFKVLNLRCKFLGLRLGFSSLNFRVLGLTLSFSVGSKTSNSELQIASLVSKNTLEVLLGSNSVAITQIVIFHNI